MEFVVRDGNQKDREWVLDVLVREWHGPLIERADEFIDAGELPWFIAESGGLKIGLATTLLGSDFVEIVTLNSFHEGRGVGTALIDAVVTVAKVRSADDVRLYTTNDNLHALGFYQRYGFTLHALHRGSITRARQFKPEIPLIGRDGIPMRDELELRLPVDGLTISSQ